MPPMSQPHLPQLGYAQFVPWHRRKKIRHRIILLLLVAAAVSAGVRWGPRLWHRVHLYWAQRQCMNYFAPQGQLIYASPTGEAFTRIEANAFRQPPPACWVTLGASLPDPESFPKNAEPGLDGQFDGLAPTPVFLHSRTSGGKNRLVVVQFGEQALGGKGHRVLCCRVVKPATLFRGPVLLWEESTIIVSSFEWTAAVSVLAGKIDDSDSSHFSIEITVDDQSKIIDGWLQNDDKAKMEMRDGAAKKP